MKVKVRETFMAIFAIAIIVVVAALAATVFDWDIPILRSITRALGIG
jgi:hypothetical protein